MAGAQPGLFSCQVSDILSASFSQRQDCLKATVLMRLGQRPNFRPSIAAALGKGERLFEMRQTRVHLTPVHRVETFDRVDAGTQAIVTMRKVTRLT